MTIGRPHRFGALHFAGALLLSLSVLATTRAATAPTDEQTAIEQWRLGRAARLQSDTGWLTLAGLFWLKDGENTFGSAASNSLQLENPALAAKAGSFVKTGETVRFVAADKSGVTSGGKPVTSLELTPDSKGDPTLLESGPLSFFLIERAGHYGIRLRDKNNPRRTGFKGLEYFPVSTDWVFEARFEPYEPHRQIKIVNILGMEENMDSPGALVFSKGGKEWKLDAILEDPQDDELFVMFADTTSGKETYGAGRFMYVPLPKSGRVPLDFNKAYNPPCAFNDFATCPLPPFQNRLALRVDAGEKNYAGSHQGR